MQPQIERLESLIPRLPERDRAFASDLVSKGRERGLSYKQAWWVGELIRRATTNAQPARLDNFAGIIALFERAGRSLKFPKVRLRTLDGYTVCLAVCGERSRHPGAINLTDGGGYRSGKWWGRIERDGRITLSQHGERIRATLLDLLAQLSADPAGTAAAYGKLTGNCTFCNKPLEDDKSTAVGYGKICASRFGLPWGAVAARKALLSRAS